MTELPMHPRLLDEAVVAELPEGEVMVATRDSSRALLLNETGAVVVSLCTGEISVDQMTELFADTLGVDRERADSDIRAVLGELAREGLLHTTTGDGELEP